jgi:DNA damage-inducible protein 1
MLKAHQACIDLSKNALRIQDREVRFLSEHELPDNARDQNIRGAVDELPPVPGAGLSPSNVQSQSKSHRQAPTSSSAGTLFSGSSHTLGTTPRSAVPSSPPGRSSRNSHAPSGRPSWPETDIKTLVDLGLSREMAIQSLDAANGNVDIAASLLF